jgi:DNA invertase Pin-like site-specific DNA recombinase
MTRTALPRLRCAIYTRVSTDAGLEQEFNSLDNQREAAEAYIRSQAQEGWRCLPAHYDDGGFSGGSLERPALQRLLEDIRAGLVDVVVVYKVDRLTRSLADFAKLVELFDEQEVSFVSVTQSFNTTSSMGRLTLNVLLSFAQFEREVTGERIRDKIAASKKKGIWMGGHVPLGYRIESGKLVVDEAETATVRLIFERYLALGSLTPVLRGLRQQGIVTKQRPLANGTVRGGIAFTRGPLAYLLKNRTYIGETVHRGQSYPGEHEAIIARELFEAVQEKLASQSRSSGQRQTLSRALLMGRLFDDRNNRMTPSHANKAGRRYRYYVSNALLQGRAEEAGSVTRVSASDLEQAILRALRERWPGELDDSCLIERHLARAVLGPNTIELTLRLSPLVQLSDTDCTLANLHQGGSDAPDDAPDGPNGTSEVITITWSRLSSSRRREIIRPSTCTPDDPRPIRADRRATLVRAIALGRRWLAEIASGEMAGLEVLAVREGCSKRHVAMTISLAFLSPEVVQAAVDGRLPRGAGLKTLTEPPLTWLQQHQALGI